MKKYKCYIGVDPGVNTGLAVWHAEKKIFLLLQTLMIHQAIEKVEQHLCGKVPDILVRIEDPRLRKWFGKSGREQLQGAGSVKRDAKIWEDFCITLYTATTL